MLENGIGQKENDEDVPCSRQHASASWATNIWICANYDAPNITSKEKVPLFCMTFCDRRLKSLVSESLRLVLVEEKWKSLFA